MDAWWLFPQFLLQPIPDLGHISVSSEKESFFCRKSNGILSPMLPTGILNEMVNC